MQHFPGVRSSCFLIPWIYNTSGIQRDYCTPHVSALISYLNSFMWKRYLRKAESLILIGLRNVSEFPNCSIEVSSRLFIYFPLSLVLISTPWFYFTNYTFPSYSFQIFILRIIGSLCHHSTFHSVLTHLECCIMQALQRRVINVLVWIFQIFHNYTPKAKLLPHSRTNNYINSHE